MAFRSGQAEPPSSLTIPAGAVLTVEGTLPEGNQLVSAEWNGQAILIYARDLWTRGETLEA